MIYLHKDNVKLLTVLPLRDWVLVLIFLNNYENMFLKTIMKILIKLGYKVLISLKIQKAFICTSRYFCLKN